MDKFEIITYVLSVIVVFNIFFIRNLLIQTEKLEDLVVSERMVTYMKVKDLLDKMREIDLRGAFESDDEVGSVFQDLKKLIEETKQRLK